MEEIGRVENKLKKTMKVEVFLALIRHVIGVFYYFLDNLT